MRASLEAQIVKNLPSMMETRVQFWVWEKPLEKDMAAHTSIPTWRRIPWDHKELDTIDQLTYTHIHLIQCPFEQTIQQKQKELGENWDRGAGKRKASGGSMTGTLPEACQSHVAASCTDVLAIHLIYLERGVFQV